MKPALTKTLITILRMAIGWHFLYEGVIKWAADSWSAAGYLNNTNGFLSGLYHWLAASPVRMNVIDFLNVYGLMLIGLALTIGLLSKWASISGVLLLLLYYFAYPPFGISLLGGDGTSYIINPLLIEAIALLFLVFYKDRGYGIENLIHYFKKKKQTVPENKEEPTPDLTSRREALKNIIGLPVLGVMGWSAFESNKAYNVDATTGATIKINQVALGELRGELPKGKIGKHEMSRLVMGGNLIGGWAHARDLLYAGSLFKAYNTEKKIFETLILCEQAGIDTINIGYPTMSVMSKYRKLTGSKMKVIVQVGLDEKNEDIYDNVTKAIDSGMDIIQLQGNWCDWLVRDNRLDKIAGLLDRVRSQGYIAGMGAHTVDSLIICEQNGIIPDYYTTLGYKLRYQTIEN